MDYNINIFDTLPSTNTELKAMARAGALDGTVIIAKEQTAGRGRLGRSFYSPQNSGLYMSVLLRPKKNIPLSFVTPAAAVAVCRALETHNSPKLGIKWVNDIFCNGKKISGILTEVEFLPNSETIDFLVVGIGINLTTVTFPENLSGIADSVFKDKSIDKEKLITDILDNLFDFYRNIEKKEFATEYKERSLVINKNVTLISGENKKDAFVTDISDDFGLLVKLPDGSIKNINTGEISVRFNS